LMICQDVQDVLSSADRPDRSDIPYFLVGIDKFIDFISDGILPLYSRRSDVMNVCSL